MDFLDGRKEKSQSRMKRSNTVPAGNVSLTLFSDRESRKKRFFAYDYPKMLFAHYLRYIKKIEIF